MCRWCAGFYSKGGDFFFFFGSLPSFHLSQCITSQMTSIQTPPCFQHIASLKAQIIPGPSTKP